MCLRLEALEVSGRLPLTWLGLIDLQNFRKSEGPSAEAIKTTRRRGDSGAMVGAVAGRRWGGGRATVVLATGKFPENQLTLVTL